MTSGGGGGGGKIRFEIVQPYPTYQKVRRPQTITQQYWMAEGHIGTSLTSGVPRNFVRGVQQIQLRTEDRENGNLGAVDL